MRYFEVIENGYILAIGQGAGHIEIDEDRYNTIFSVIRSNSLHTDTIDYRLKLDLTWEEYEVLPTPMAHLFQQHKEDELWQLVR